MFKWFADRAPVARRVREDEQGFTLIELLVVVIIIGILAAIAIPVFLNQRSSAQDSAAQSDLRNLASAAQAYYADNDGTYTGMTFPVLQATPYDVNTSDGVTGHGVTVTGGGDSFTATATSAAGNTFTFDSTTGRVSP
jgi:type IV pilus assembly protein PilA